MSFVVSVVVSDRSSVDATCGSVAALSSVTWIERRTVFLRQQHTPSTMKELHWYLWWDEWLLRGGERRARASRAVSIVCKTRTRECVCVCEDCLPDVPVETRVERPRCLSGLVRGDRFVGDRTIGEERLDWILFSTPHTSISKAIETITNRFVTVTNDQQVHIVLLKTQCHQTKKIVLSITLE